MNGTVDPFGWRNVWTFKTGVQQEVSEKATVRVGYNYSQMPLRPEVVISATGAPATFEHHITGGAGFKMFPFLTRRSVSLLRAAIARCRAVPQFAECQSGEPRRVQHPHQLPHRTQLSLLIEDAAWNAKCKMQSEK